MVRFAGRDSIGQGPSAGRVEVMDEFTALVADALAHLYDHPYLQTHELGRRLVADPGASRGRALQRLLGDAIAELKPAQDTGSAHAWRTYRYLFLRYVQAQTPREVARDLGVSERQARRTYREAVDALASLLWDRTTAAASQPPAGPSPVEREVDQLASAGHGGKADLVEVFAGLRTILEALAREHGCALDLAIPTGLPRLGLDRVVARQILLNLAVAAIERGPGRLRIEAVESEGAVVVALRLAGAGPRGSPDPARIAVAARLAESEGGSVAERPGVDTLLSARLPVAKRSLVLVVDDNPDVALVLGRYLASVDVDVVRVDRGELALPRAGELRPAAIVLDVMMAGQDGWETLQQLKNHPETQAIPVLVCSVLREPELARFLGAAALVPKPVTRPELLAALEQIGLVRPGAAVSLA